MKYGTNCPRDEYAQLRLVRDGIGAIEPTAAGNVILRIGRELRYGEGAWAQSAYVVLDPHEEAAALRSDILRCAGGLDARLTPLERLGRWMATNAGLDAESLTEETVERLFANLTFTTVPDVIEEAGLKARVSRREPRPGEACQCGQPATVVLCRPSGDVPWCGEYLHGRVRVAAAATPEQVAAARGWIKDCAWANLNPEDVDELSDEVVVAGVGRHYGGGWLQFLRDGEPGVAGSTR